MSKRHRRTPNVIFAQPISGNIKWRDVESLLKFSGAVISERAGSRVAAQLNDRRVSSSHPSPNMDKGAVRDLQRFLENAGITS